LRKKRENKDQEDGDGVCQVGCNPQVQILRNLTSSRKRKEGS
jgi:hypothetical protein